MVLEETLKRREADTVANETTTEANNDQPVLQARQACGGGRALREGQGWESAQAEGYRVGS